MCSLVYPLHTWVFIGCWHCYTSPSLFLNDVWQCEIVVRVEGSQGCSKHAHLTNDFVWILYSSLVLLLSLKFCGQVRLLVDGSYGLWAFVLFIYLLSISMFFDVVPLVQCCMGPCNRDIKCVVGGYLLNLLLCYFE